MKKIKFCFFIISFFFFCQNVQASLEPFFTTTTTIQADSNSIKPIVVAGGFMISPIQLEAEAKNKINYTNPLIVLGSGMLFMSSSMHQVQKEWHTKNVKTFTTSVDDYLAFAPNVAAFGLNIVGVKAKHSFKDIMLVAAMANGIMFLAVNGTKYATHVLRPDGSAYNSFPSGHTALAFTGAQIMHEEYGNQSIIYSIAGYTMGGATGFLRMVNNRHWFSDVVAGAGFGMLSTKLAYRLLPWAHKKVFKNENMAILPMYLPNGGGLGFSFNLK
jgi:membrane-associated phospholipid phosphatase